MPSPSSKKFGLGLDVFTIVNEVPIDGCNDFKRMSYIDDFACT